jgi:hypothetical protein
MLYKYRNALCGINTFICIYRRFIYATNVSAFINAAIIRATNVQVNQDCRTAVEQFTRLKKAENERFINRARFELKWYQDCRTTEERLDASGHSGRVWTHLRRISP